MEKLSNSQLNKMTKLQLKEVVRDYEGTILGLEKQTNDLQAELDAMTDSHMTTNTEDAKEIQRLREQINSLNKTVADYRKSENVCLSLKDENESLNKNNIALMNESSFLRKDLVKYKLWAYSATIAFIIALCFIVF